MTIPTSPVLNLMPACFTGKKPEMYLAGYPTLYPYFIIYLLPSQVLYLPLFHPTSDATVKSPIDTRSFNGEASPHRIALRLPLRWIASCCLRSHQAPKAGAKSPPLARERRRAGDPPGRPRVWSAVSVLLRLAWDSVPSDTPIDSASRSPVQRRGRAARRARRAHSHQSRAPAKPVIAAAPCRISGGISGDRGWGTLEPWPAQTGSEMMQATETTSPIDGDHGSAASPPPPPPSLLDLGSRLSVVCPSLVPFLVRPAPSPTITPCVCCRPKALTPTPASPLPSSAPTSCRHLPSSPIVRRRG